MAKSKKHMFVIDFWEDIQKNFETLEQYKDSTDLAEKKFFSQLILNGICFMVIRNDDKILFGPSRFIGYHNNTIISHKSSKIYGPETNEAISQLLGYNPIEDDEVDELYSKYCYEIGINPRAAGSFGISRKYWYKSNSDDHIYNRFENHRVSEKKNYKVRVKFNPTYQSWKFIVTGMTSQIVTGEIIIPLLNNQKVEVHGNIVGELIGRFEWYPDDHSYIIAVNKWDEMNKEQQHVLLRNTRLKLKEILPGYLESYG